MSWQERSKIWMCGLLIKIGRLSHDDFTRDELNELLQPFFPRSFPIEVPAGAGTVRVTEARLQFNPQQQRLALECFSELELNVLDAKVYRAHVILVVSARPVYQVAEGMVRLTDVDVDVIQLVNDNFSFIKDTQDLISQVLPGLTLGKSLSNLLTQPLISVASVATTGRSDKLVNYLQLFLSADKQKILDHHKPEITRKLLAQLDHDALHYQLSDGWREQTFLRWGKQVSVEKDSLRFSF